jgi:mRNA interferase MazF
VRRGEVWWAVGGDKRRPYLILTRDSAIPLLSKIVVAPATTTIRNIPTEILLDRADGMSQRCVIQLDAIMCVPKRSLRRRITTLRAQKLEEICQALTYAIDC